MSRLLPSTVTSQLADDMLYGVEEIRDFLKLKEVRQVYRMRERGKAPIFKMDGVGIAARKSALLAYIAQKEREAVNA